MLYGGSSDTDNRNANAFGFTAEMVQAVAQNIEIWPENWTAVMLFNDMCTQWNVGPGGYTGLRYETLPVLFRLHGIVRKDQRGVFSRLRVLERAALEHLRSE